MLKAFIYTIILLYAFPCFSQNQGKLSIQINYGLAGNFFVRGYDEAYSPSYFHKYFYKKNFLGTVAGIYADYHINSKSFLLAEYSRSINSSKKNYYQNNNGNEIYIRDFKLRYINNSFLIGYGYDVKIKKLLFKPDAGIVLIYNSDQSMTIEDFNGIRIDESNYKNDNAVEGGVFLGLSCTKKIDTKFDIGLKARLYYLISVNSLEAITLTPTLTYRFVKKLRSKNHIGE